MEKLRLIIGNKNYSSWSLRPWIAMKMAGLKFEETVIPLYEENSKEKLLVVSPVGTVPVLKDEDLTISDSLAILEYLADKYPQSHLLPDTLQDRAKLRSVCSEMHSGFFPLRGAMPMNTKKTISLNLSDDVVANVNRVKAIWLDCRGTYASKGPFLFGHFTIADAMFAPVVSRFKTYGIELDPVCAEYCQIILDLPAMKLWYADAAKETWVIQQSEIG